MKIKQKIILFSLFALSFGAASIVAPLSDTVLAAGACSKNADYDDSCMEQNRAKTPLSPTEFSAAVHACEGRDTGGALSGVSFDSQSGNCSNAVASCYQKVLDKRVCTNDTYLAYAADGSLGGDNGDLTGEDWDYVIDDTNTFTGGEDLKTNSGIKADRQRQYEKQIDDSGVCDARGTTGGADACKAALKEVFTQCYDSLGGEHAAVDQSALDSCIQSKRQAIAQNEAECTAANGQWDKTVGPIQGNRCKPKPNSNNNDPNNPNNNGGVNGANNGSGGLVDPDDLGKCGGAKTNLLPSCTGNGTQAIGSVLKLVIQILTILVGIAAVGGIAYAAVLYASATDNSSQTQNAINLIRNIVIGILVYGFMIAIINWLVPGSVIG